MRVNGKHIDERQTGAKPGECANTIDSRPGEVFSTLGSDL